MSLVFDRTQVDVEGRWKVSLLFHPAISSLRVGEFLEWALEEDPEQVSLWLVDLATTGRAELLDGYWHEVAWLVVALRLIGFPVAVTKEGS